MKKVLCALVALMLMVSPVLAEGIIDENPEVIIELITPSPAPAGEVFSNEDLILTLPYGMKALDVNARAGYEAAVQAAYPDAARTVLVAADDAASKTLIAAIMPGEADALSAAREAAEGILGSGDSVQELTLGENNYSSFACAIGSFNYYLYCLADGERIMMLCVSGLSQTETEAMLTSVIF